MPEPDAVRGYLGELDHLRQQAESTPELSLREPLLRLLHRFAEAHHRPGLLIAPEARAEGVGQPDVYAKDGPRLVGFVETKAPDSDLSRLLRSDEQLKRYRRSLPNWILTDYYEFRFLRDGRNFGTAMVRERPDQLADLFGQWLDYAPPAVRTSRQLAVELARRARLLRDGISGAIDDEPAGGPLREALRFYRETLMEDLDQAGFADTFAQTLTYGMFLGWLRGAEHEGEFDLAAAAAAIPRSVPFLRSAVSLLTDPAVLPDAVVRILDDLAALYDNTRPGPISDEIKGAGAGRDPIIYFYETFLEQYDKGERMRRGVYYTPPELVQFLIHAADDLLSERFARPNGLADDDVRLLDPATGTGTFLLAAADQALARVAPRGTAAQRRTLRDHVLPHFNGFELLPAPYAVAHLKLNAFTAEHGYPLGDDERARVFLTNTLEATDETGGQLAFLSMLRGIVEEAQAAQSVKSDTPVLVVMGNPPYERTNHNRGEFIDGLHGDFFRVDGERIPDRNPAPLNDDYLRFVRWAVWKLLEQTAAPGHGVLAFVTNRAWVERVLHRGVRQFLLDRFDEAWVYDLHGDQREWYPDRVDEKVFKAVQAGICLVVLVRYPDHAIRAPATVHYRGTFGTRDTKLTEAAEARLDDDAWQTLKPRRPLWLFVPYEVPAEYDQWPSVADLFPVSSIGVQTHRDQLVVARTKQELRDRLARFADPDIPDRHWREDHGLRDTDNFDLLTARPQLQDEGPRNVIKWHFRGLERRWVAFDDRLIDRMRAPVSDPLTSRDDNLALVFANGSLTDGPYALVTRRPVPSAALSWRTLGQAYQAPLYLPVADVWQANIAGPLPDQIGAHGHDRDAETLLYYVYAVLNSPAYRHQFAHGLRYLYPRVPIARDPDLYHRIADLGRELALLHLHEHSDIAEHALAVDGDDRGIIEPPEDPHDPDTDTLTLGPQLRAHSVTADAWHYQHGGYPVLHNFLDTRRGSPLADEELDQFRGLIAICELTTRLLPDLDLLIERAADAAFTASELGITSAQPAG